MVVRFQVKVGKIGHSLRVTIPKEIAEALEIQLGDAVYVWTDDKRIIMEKKK